MNTLRVLYPIDSISVWILRYLLTFIQPRSSLFHLTASYPFHFKCVHCRSDTLEIFPLSEMCLSSSASSSSMIVFLRIINIVNTHKQTRKTSSLHCLECFLFLLRVMAEIDVSAIRFVKYEKRVCFLILSMRRFQIDLNNAFSNICFAQKHFSCRVIGSKNFQKSVWHWNYSLNFQECKWIEWENTFHRKRRLKLNSFVKSRLMCYTKAIFKLKFHGIHIAFPPKW